MIRSEFKSNASCWLSPKVYSPHSGRFFEGRWTPVLVVLIFVSASLLWKALDRSVPAYDAAWHSLYSSAFRQALLHPTHWNDLLFGLNPLYPAGAWLFNGVCKVLIGDSQVSENLISVLHLAILSFGTWWSMMLLTGDRMKAVLTIYFLNCCPIVLALQHVPLVDLAFTGFLMLFVGSSLLWWQKKSWGCAVLMAVSFGVGCTFKQIVVLYAGPAILVGAFCSLAKKDFRSCGQLALVVMVGLLFFATWLVPNFEAITNYSRIRGDFVRQNFNMLDFLVGHLLSTVCLVLQNMSLLLCVALFSAAFGLGKKDYKKIAPLVGSAVVGVLLINLVAFYNMPEGRYFAPATVVCCMVIGMFVSNLIRHSLKAEIATMVLILLAGLQSCFLCFQPLPPVFSVTEQLRNPVNFYSFVREPYVMMHLPFVPPGDFWGQNWLVETIDKADPGRPVYVNVLSNSPAYNLGSLAYVARTKKSKIKVTTWRGIGADMRDTFAFTEESLGYMQWVVAKTGDEQGEFFDSNSKQNYLLLMKLLKNKDKFIEHRRRVLPDGTELIVYRNKRWII